MIVVHRVRLRNPVGYPKGLTELVREQVERPIQLLESGDVVFFAHGYWRRTPRENVVEVIYSVVEDSVAAATVVDSPRVAPKAKKK